MKCPYCSSKSNKVLDKRETEDITVTRRRRECEKCKKRFTTYERFEALNLLIVKKNGNREQFDKKKLEMGLIRACEKRPIPFEKIQKAFQKAGLKIDSTVFPGGENKKGNYFYDFKSVPLKDKWRFSSDLCKEDQSGEESLDLRRACLHARTPSSPARLAPVHRETEEVERLGS